MPKSVVLVTVALLIAVGPAVPPPASAATVTGAASVWSYLRDDSVYHAYVVPALSLTLREFAGNAVRFETSLRGYSDIRNGESNDDQLRILRAVLIYAPSQSPWDIRLGQQWLTEGVGRGNVAGPWVKRRFGSRSSVTVYGGARLVNAVLLDEKNANNGYAMGVHARSKVGIFALGASYFYIGKSNDVLFQAAGVEANARPCRKLMTRVRFDMNLEQGSVETAQLLADWIPEKRIDIVGEFRVQTPRIFEDSYFTRFLEDASTTYLRGGARWNFHEDYYVSGTGVTLFTDNPDPLYKVRFAIGQDNLELGFTHWLSVASGSMDGFYGQFRDKLNIMEKSVGEVFAGFDFAKGSNADLRPDSESQSVYFGLSIFPVSSFSVSGTAEQIRDIDSRKDWRGLLSIGYKFAGTRLEPHP